MNIGKNVCREKVAIILGGAAFLISKSFLQRMGAVLDLGKGQVTGVTMNLGESSTGHCVIDLIPDCETLTIAPGSVIKHSEESVQAPGINIENNEFSNLLCGSERVTVIDVIKHRNSLVGADCEQSCRRWTIGNFADDSDVFVVKDECCKNQQTLLPEPWTGRTIIEDRCDEFEGHVSCLTREEGVDPKNMLSNVERRSVCWFNQEFCATKTGPTGQKQRMFQEEDGFDFRDISAELRRFSPDSVTVHTPGVVCRAGFSHKNQQELRSKCKPLINHVCSLIHDQLSREELGFLGAPWPPWTLDLASAQTIQAMGKLGVTRSRPSFGKKQVLGGSVIRKPGIMFVPPSVVERNVKRKPGLDLKNLPRTVSLEQVKALVRELEQEDVCDMEVDLAEVRWQESDTEVLNAFAQDLETAVECLLAEEDEDKDVNMRGDEHHDGSDVECRWRKVENMMKLHQKGKFIQDMTLYESREHCESFTPTWDIQA